MNEAAVNQRISEMFKTSVIKYLQQNRFAKRTDAPTNDLSDVIDLPKKPSRLFKNSPYKDVFDARFLPLSTSHLSRHVQLEIVKNHVKTVKQAAILIASGFIGNREAIEELKTKFDNKTAIRNIEEHSFHDLEISELETLIFHYCNRFKILPAAAEAEVQHFVRMAGHAYISSLEEMSWGRYIDSDSPLIAMIVKAHPVTVLRDALATQQTKTIISTFEMLKEHSDITPQQIVDCFPNPVDALAFCLKNITTLNNDNFPGLQQKAMDDFLSVIFPVLPGIKGRYGFDMRLVPNILALYEDVPNFLEGAVSLAKEQFIENVKARCDSVLDGMALFGETRMSNDELVIYLTGMDSPERDFAVAQAIETYASLKTQTKNTLVAALGANESLKRISENYLLKRMTGDVEFLKIAGHDPIMTADLTTLLNTPGIQFYSEAQDEIVTRVRKALGLTPELKQDVSLSKDEIAEAVIIRKSFMSIYDGNENIFEINDDVRALAEYLSAQERLYSAGDLARTL